MCSVFLYVSSLHSASVLYSLQCTECKQKQTSKSFILCYAFVTFVPTLMDSLFCFLPAASSAFFFITLCLAQMKNHPSNMQGQLNNVSHTPPHVVSFFCLCRSAAFIGSTGMPDHHMREASLFLSPILNV